MAAEESWGIGKELEALWHMQSQSPNGKVLNCLVCFEIFSGKGRLKKGGVCEISSNYLSFFELLALAYPGNHTGKFLFPFWQGMRAEVVPKSYFLDLTNMSIVE